MLVGKQISGLLCYSVPKGYAVIVARAIMLKRTCTERFTGAPLDYSLMTNIFV